MTSGNIDVDLFNKEQRPFNYDYDCLELGAYLRETGKVDYSDQEYEAWRDEQMEACEDAYREKMELEFN